MARTKKSYLASFEAQVALAAIRGETTANELAAKHQIHPTLVSNWKKALLDAAPGHFADGARPAKAPDQPETAELFEQIGRLEKELEWLNKTPLTAEQKRVLVEENHPERRHQSLDYQTPAEVYRQGRESGGRQLRSAALFQIEAVSRRHGLWCPMGA